MTPTASGMTIILLAGAIGSATLLPMKFVKNWQWENTWLLYATNAYLFLPLLVAWLTVPQLDQVYSESGMRVILPVVLFGLGWGLSVVMLGLAVAAVGLAVSTGIIMGCSISLGSLIPLFWADSSHLLTSGGLRIIFADLVILAGVLLCARAGFLRDRRETDDPEGKGAGLKGIVICFVAGILTPLLNLGLASGGEITRLAVQHGAAEHQAANGVWGLCVSAGALPSIAYCVMLLGRHKTWGQYRGGRPAINTLLCLVMGVFFITSTVGYGMGALRMGDLGPAIGWPVYISSLIIGNNFWGWITGEWRDAPTNSFLTMLAGISVQIAGIVLLFATNTGGS